MATKKNTVENVSEEINSLTESEINNITEITEVKEAENLAVQKNHFGENVVVPHQLDTATVDGLFSEMEAKQTGDLSELTANYLSFADWKIGEERNYLFTAMTTMTKPDTGEVMPAAILMDKDRQNHIVASKVIVGNLMKLDKIPCPVRIRSNGKVKGANGSYYSVQVFTF